MIFNSVIFFAFIAIFLPLYFSLRGKARLILCLVASYYFYSVWDERFLILIFASTVVDYIVGRWLDQTEDEKKRKRLLLVSMVVNLGFLAFFKYFNFFISSFQEMLASFGLNSSASTLNIILPVGISFYTFQSMSYTIDVWKRKIPIEKDFIRFATFISFFPQLVAGPIVRASDFLPQFQKDRKFEWDRFTAGTGQIIMGFFKKIAVADSLAPFVDQCFMHPGNYGSLHLLIGIIFWSFQIYCDFSGYSDIAIGLARVMGFDFPDNFKKPYFSKNFSEFWARWHISLSSWLRDYLYIPLGGNRSGSLGSYLFIGIGLVISVILTGWLWLIPFYLLGIALVLYLMRKNEKNRQKTFTYLNNMTTMLLGGLWHGTTWAYVFWGFLHGLYLIGQRVFGPPWTKLLNAIKTPKFIQNAFSIFFVYFFTCLAWIYFRAPDFEIANLVIYRISIFEKFNLAGIENVFQVVKGFLLIGILVGIELLDLRWTLYKVVQENAVFRVASFAIMIWLIAFFGTFGSNSFIYFQF